MTVDDWPLEGIATKKNNIAERWRFSILSSDMTEPFLHYLQCYLHMDKKAGILRDVHWYDGIEPTIGFSQNPYRQSSGSLSTGCVASAVLPWWIVETPSHNDDIYHKSIHPSHGWTTRGILYVFFCVSHCCHHASKSGNWIMYHHQLGLPNLPDLLWKWFDSWCLKENLETIPSGEPIFQLLDGKVWKHCLFVWRMHRLPEETYVSKALYAG